MYPECIPTYSSTFWLFLAHWSCWLGSRRLWHRILASGALLGLGCFGRLACQLLHVVCEPADGYEVLRCEGNPAGYECLGCKSFKGVGICSHVLALNHILTRYNVRYELKQLQTSASKKKAYGTHGAKKPLPALQCYVEPELDSSDEEEAALLALAAQGR